MSHGREAARDILYGRRGGRWAPPPQTERDVASIEKFRAERAAMAAATAAAEAQRTIWDELGGDAG